MSSDAARTATVVVADTQQIVREGVRRLLDSDPDFEVVGEAKDDGELIREVNEKKPDIVLTEILACCLYGIEPIRIGGQQGRSTRFLVFSNEQRADQLAEALRAGASGFVQKTAATRDILEALRAVRDGRAYIPAALSEELSEMADASPTARITKRERAVLRLVAEGWSSSEIGRELKIERRTVDSHRANLMKKLGVHKAADLVRYAVRHGIVSP